MLAELGLLHTAILGIVQAPHDGIRVKLCQGLAIPAHKVGDGVPEDGSVAVDVHAVEQVKEVEVVAVGEVSLQAVEPGVLV